MDDDEEKGRKLIFLSCWGWSGDLSWGTNRPQKINPTEVTTFFDQAFFLW